MQKEGLNMDFVDFSLQGELCNIAATQKQQHIDSKSLCTGVVLPIVAIPFVSLAKARVESEQPLLDTEILAVYFDADAVVALSELPSLYWLWAVVEEAALLLDSPDERIDAQLLQKACKSIKRNLVGKYDTTTPIEELSAYEISKQTAAGLLLCDLERECVVDNPVLS